MDDSAMDGGVLAESAPPPAPPQHQHVDLEAAQVEEPIMLETCDETDRLLAADDSSQELVPEMEDVEMENRGDASVEKEKAADNELDSIAQEMAVDGEKPADAATEKTVEEPEPATPPVQKLEIQALVTEEKKAEDVAMKGDEKQEHEALEDERRWYGELPAFVKRVYGLTEESAEPVTAVKFPVCSTCCEDGKPRAMASVCCQDEQCAFKGVDVCSACFTRTHDTVTDRFHRQRLTKACPHCHLNRVSDWCFGCDLSFCSACYTAIHDGMKNIQQHRKFSVEGTTGDMLIRAKWTPYFKAVIMQLQSQNKGPVAAHLQHNTHGNGAPIHSPSTQALRAALMLKRKRSDGPQEIICIDEDGSGSEKVAAKQQHQSTPQTAQYAAAASKLAAASASSTRASGYYNALPHRPSLSASSSFDSNGGARESTPLSTHSFTSASSTMSTPVTGVPATAPYNQKLNTWQIPPPAGHAYVSQPIATPPTTVAIPSTAGTVTQLQNPIESVMFERLNQLSQRIMQVEEEITSINLQVVQASYQSIVNAHNMMAQLENAQQRLRHMSTKRDLTVVHLVAQSKSIISKVKQLRIDLLGDIPQVHAACYRRCLQLSSQISEAEATLRDMNQRMETTLEHVSVMSSEVFHRTVSSISGAIHTQHQTVANFKEERENEVVRLVQYHLGIRETLKRAVQQNQLRRQQQGEFIQPTHPPHPPQPVTIQPMPSNAYPVALQQQQAHQSQGLYQQFQHQQHQQQQQQQQQQQTQQLQPLGFNYNEPNSQRNSDADAIPPISPPPFP